RSDGHGAFSNADSSAILSPPQDLSVFRRQCAEDRLQGREALAALCLRARQDRAESDYSGVRQEAAGAGAGHQTRPLSRIVALCDPLADDGAQTTEHRRPNASGRAKVVREADLAACALCVVRPPMVGTELDPSLTADEAGQLKMMQIILIGLGAGAAAALLFASVVSGSIAAIFLFYLAPLPILIAALGWSHVAGLIAAA